MHQYVTRNNQIIVSVLIACILFWLLLIGGESQLVQVLRTICGSIYMLFLPGWWMTQIFFDQGEIDGLERFALSFALSISVIPLLVFYLNLAGIQISALMVWAVVLCLMIVCRGWIYIRK